MKRKAHLELISDESLSSYTQWLRDCLDGSYVDFPEWLILNLKAELGNALAEAAERTHEPQQRIR